MYCNAYIVSLIGSLSAKRVPRFLFLASRKSWFMVIGLIIYLSLHISNHIYTPTSFTLLKRSSSITLIGMFLCNYLKVLHSLEIGFIGSERDKACHDVKT